MKKNILNRILRRSADEFSQLAVMAATNKEHAAELRQMANEAWREFKHVKHEIQELERTKVSLPVQ